MVNRMERKLDQEFGQFKSSELELDSRIEAAEAAPSTADGTEPGMETARTNEEEEAMVKPAEVPA